MNLGLKVLWTERFLIEVSWTGRFFIEKSWLFKEELFTERFFSVGTQTKSFVREEMLT